jgi:hypothetical protein
MFDQAADHYPAHDDVLNDESVQRAAVNQSLNASALSGLCVFNAGARERHFDLVRRRGNSEQLLQPPNNLSPLFRRLLG